MFRSCFGMTSAGRTRALCQLPTNPPSVLGRSHNAGCCASASKVRRISFLRFGRATYDRGVGGPTMQITKVAASAVVLVCAGCGNSARTVVPEPNKITLQDALVSTVQALNAAYVEARKQGNVIMGYYPCTVTANYNVSATGVTTNKIGGGIEAGLPGTGVAISANASREDGLTGLRGNTVQVVFASSLCLPSAGAKTADAAASAGGKGEAARRAGTTDPIVVFRLRPPPEVFGVR